MAHLVLATGTTRALRVLGRAGERTAVGPRGLQLLVLRALVGGYLARWLIGAGPVIGAVASPAADSLADWAMTTFSADSSAVSASPASSALSTSGARGADGLFGLINDGVIGLDAGFLAPGHLLHVDVEKQLDGLLLDRLDHGVVHLVTFALVLDQRVALTHAAQADAILEVVHLVQVLTPLAVKHGEDHAAFQLAQAFLTDLLLKFGVLLPGLIDEGVAHGRNGLVALELVGGVLGGVLVKLEREHGLEGLEQAVPIPVGGLAGTFWAPLM